MDITITLHGIVISSKDIATTRTSVVLSSKCIVTTSIGVVTSSEDIATGDKLLLYLTMILQRDMSYCRNWISLQYILLQQKYSIALVLIASNQGCCKNNYSNPHSSYRYDHGCCFNNTLQRQTSLQQVCFIPTEYNLTR